MSENKDTRPLSEQFVDVVNYITSPAAKSIRFNIDVEKVQPAIEERDAKIAELERKLEIAREALLFYSLKSNYSLCDEGRNYISHYVCYELNEDTYADEELGTAARKALEALK
jgi:hypothetical protein